MALPALATLEGLDDRGVDISDVSRAQAAIDDASALIHHTTNNRWVLDGAIDPAMPPVVQTVAYKVIKRSLDDAGLALQSTTLGPFSETYRAPNVGDLYLSDAEKELLLTSSNTVTGLSSVRLEAPWGFSSNCDDDDPWYQGTEITDD